MKRLKFIVEIEGDDQPELIRALNEARNQLIQGGCYLNTCGYTVVKLKPANSEVEDEFYRQWVAAHSLPSPRWTE